MDRLPSEELRTKRGNAGEERGWETYSLFVVFCLCFCFQVNIILRDILAHVTKDKHYTSPTVQQQLQSIVLKVLSSVQDLSAIIAMVIPFSLSPLFPPPSSLPCYILNQHNLQDVFLPIFDLFTGAVNIQVSKAMLENFSRYILPPRFLFFFFSTFLGTCTNTCLFQPPRYYVRSSHHQYHVRGG